MMRDYNNSRRQACLILASIFFFALFLRLSALFYFREWVSPFTLEYGDLAKNILDGNGYSFHFYFLRRDNPLMSFMPPLYPLLMTLFISSFKNGYFWLLAFQSLISTLTCLNIYFISSRLFSRPAGILAGLATALYPVFIFSSATGYLPLTLDIFLISLIILLSIEIKEKRSSFHPILAGILIGLSALSLPHMLGFIGLMAIWLTLNRVERRWGKIFLMCLFALLAIVPWTIRNYRIHHRFVLISTNGGFNFWIGNNPYMTGSGWMVDKERYERYMGRKVDYESPFFVGSKLSLPKQPGERSREDEKELSLAMFTLLPKELRDSVGRLSERQLNSAFFRAGLNFIKENPGGYVNLLANKFLYFWGFRPGMGERYESSFKLPYIVVYLLLLPLAGAGIFLFRRNWKVLSLVYFLMGYFSLVYVSFFVLTRYRWLIEPYLLVFAGASVNHLFSRLKIRKRVAR